MICIRINFWITPIRSSLNTVQIKKRNRMNEKEEKGKKNSMKISRYNNDLNFHHDHDIHWLEYTLKLIGHRFNRAHWRHTVIFFFSRNFLFSSSLRSLKIGFVFYSIRTIDAQSTKHKANHHLNSANTNDHAHSLQNKQNCSTNDLNPFRYAGLLRFGWFHNLIW